MSEIENTENQDPTNSVPEPVIDDKQQVSKTEKSVSKKGWKFYLKVFCAFLLCMVFAFGIAIFYCLNKLMSDGNLERMVNEKVSEAINMEINFEKIGISFPSLELTNIHIATDSADMKLDSYIASVKVRPDILAALRGSLMIDYLTVASSSTYLELKAIKPTDVARNESQEPSKPFDLSSINFPFKTLDISNVWVNFVNGATNEKYEVRLNNAGISYSLLSSALPYKIDAEWVGKASANVEGDFYWPSRVLGDVELNVTDMAAVKKFVPEEYQSYLKSVTGSSARASFDYNIDKNTVEVSKYDVEVAPLAKANGAVSLTSMTPLNMKASANVLPIKVSEVWPMVKDFVPAEYGLSLPSGDIGAEVDVTLVGSEPMRLSATAKPQKLEVLTSYLSDKVLVKRGNITYGADGGIVVSDLEAAIGDSVISLPSFSLSLNDMNMTGVFGAKLDFATLLKALKKYLSEGMNNFTITGKADLNGNVKGNLSDVASIKVNGSVLSDRIDLTENKTKAKGFVEALDIKFSDVGKECGQIKIDSLRASATGATINASGIVKNQKDIGFDCKAKGNINVDEFSKLAAGLFDLPVKANQYKGSLSIDLMLGGTVDNPKPSGSIVAKNVSADVTELYGLAVSELNGNVTADNDKLVLKDIKAKLLGGSVDLNGSVNNFQAMKLNAVANVKGTDLAEIRKLIGVWVPDMPKELNFAGKADLNASLSGSTAAPVIKGSAQLVNASFEHPSVLRPIEKINGRIEFNNDGLSSNGLTAFWGTSKANVTGSLKDWAKFVSNFKFTVAPLDITDAAGFFLKDSGYEFLGVGTGNGTVTGALEKIKVDCTAKVDVGTVTAVITEGGESMKFPYKNLFARAIYSDSALNVASASLKLFEGDITAKGKASLATEPIKFDFEANINGLQTQEFLKANADKKYEKTIVGGINGSAKITGDTTGLNSINGSASLAMPYGTYDSPDLIKKIAEKLKAPQLASGTIENVAGDYDIANGRISSDNAMGKSKDSKIYYRGSIGLDTTLDGSLDVEMGKKTCSSGYLKELIGNSETLNLSVKVGGSLTSPSVEIPVKDIAKKSAQNEINKLLEKNNLGSDKLKQSAGKVADKIGEGVNKLGKSLKKLFK